MLDIRLIREQPDFVKSRLATRGGDDAAKIDEVLRLDVVVRKAQTKLQRLYAERNRLSKKIGEARSKGESATELIDQVNEGARQINLLEQKLMEDGSELGQQDVLLRIPNLPHESVPIGAGPPNNRIVKKWPENEPDLAERITAALGVPDHLAIGKRLELFDFERAAKISGSGFVCFTGKGARLERALINFMLDLHTREHGYFEVSPPFLVRRESAVATSQLPKFEDQLYRTEPDDLFLAPTAEVPVTNLHYGEIMPSTKLPLKFVAYTPCFRREAGAAGVGTRGLIRMHQFDKVELVKITTPETSYDELEALTADAEKVLQLLGLDYRVIELCTGDLGFGAAKTYDIEVWAPGQNAYLEVSSCSNFEDFQARRMSLRFKDAEKNRFCHTLNGSGLALPRLFAALIETYQQPDGSIRIPEKLQPYFGAAEIG
jgi:seryl-tRNA synthetase